MVITFASHAKGPRFETGRKQLPFAPQFSCCSEDRREDRLRQGGRGGRSPIFHSEKQTQSKAAVPLHPESLLGTSQPGLARPPRVSAESSPQPVRQAQKGSRDQAHFRVPLPPPPRRPPKLLPWRLNPLSGRTGPVALNTNQVSPVGHTWPSRPQHAGATGAFAPQSKGKPTAPGTRRGRVSGASE